MAAAQAAGRDSGAAFARASQPGSVSGAGPRGRTGLYIALAFVGLLVLGALLFVGVSMVMRPELLADGHSSQSSVAPSSAPVPVVQTTTPVEVLGGGPDTAAGDGDENEGSTGAATNSDEASGEGTSDPEEGVSVALNSTPAGAMVECDGALIGNTPLEFFLPPSTAEATLTLTLAGYRDSTVRVTPDSPASIQIELARSSSSASGSASGSSGSSGRRARQEPDPASAESAGPMTEEPAMVERPHTYAPDVVDPWE
jgi:hypothetical protein